MTSIFDALARMLDRVDVTDPMMVLVIILVVMVIWSEYLRLIQSREHTKDRNEIMLPAIRAITADIEKTQQGMIDGLNDIKNAISAMTGRPM